jgi:DNA-binding protein Fis
VEDKQVVVLLIQKLNHFYPEFTTNPASKVLPTMLDILERCFADNQISLIQSVIRVSHIKSDDSMINPPVRQIWSTFTETISMVKQFVLQRPNLNMIECAILSDSFWNKAGAGFVAVSQCLIAYIMVSHVLFVQTADSADSDGCDFVTIFYDSMSQRTWNDSFGCVLKCYWRDNFSFMMTVIAVVMSCIKVNTQIQDQYKFYSVFKQILKEKTDHMAADYLLFLFDCFVNVILSILTVFLTCFLISRSDEVTDLVLNCLAITFIVELDEDLNHLDPVEVNDLVIQSFKKYLIDDMMRECKSKQSSNSDVADTSQLTLVKDNNVLISADYSSNPASTKVNLEVLEIVKKYIASNNHLMLANNMFEITLH